MLGGQGPRRTAPHGRGARSRQAGQAVGAAQDLGIIPFGNRIKNYFDSYTSAQGHIASILQRLESGKKELHLDNAAIDTERQKLWTAMGELEQMIHIAKTLDERLEAKALELDSSDPEKAKALRESALFYVRQRTQDLLTQMAVSVQGYLALDLVKKNNVELVKGVDRASTTTVGALRTAVTVAQAMTNQRLVLGQITALNKTTSDIIDSTSTLLREQTAQIHEQPPRARSRWRRSSAPSRTSMTRWTRSTLQGARARFDEADGECPHQRGRAVEGYIARAEGQAQAQAKVASQTPSLLALDK